MGRVSSISSGMTQSLPALRLLPRPLHQRTASSSKHASTCSTASTLFLVLLLWVLLPSGSAAAVFGLLNKKNKKYLTCLNYWMKIATPRLCLLWHALRGSSSRWETVSTCLLMLSILGEEMVYKVELGEIVFIRLLHASFAPNSVLNQPAR